MGNLYWSLRTGGLCVEEVIKAQVPPASKVTQNLSFSSEVLAISIG